jgi:predicted protein tyrosine phosphatase
LDPALYEEVKAEIKSKVKVWPSAYASAQLVQEYKRRGGRYAGSKPRSSGLPKWFKEDWVDLTRPLKNGGYAKCGRPSTDMSQAEFKRTYPKCVPASRAARMTPAQVKSAISRKRAAEKKKPKGQKSPTYVRTNPAELPAIYVYGRMETDELFRLGRTDNVLAMISLGDKGIGDPWFLEDACDQGIEVLRLEFGDVLEGEPDAPDEEDMRLIVDFLEEVLPRLEKEGGILLIHCEAGIARSGASATLAWVLTLPDATPKEIAELLVEDRKQIYPNEYMLEMGLPLVGKDPAFGEKLLEEIDKMAGVKYAFHVSRSKNDRAIKEKGLKADHRGRVYVWADQDVADWFFDLHEGDGHQMSMWLVDVSGLRLTPDPETEDMSEWSTMFSSGESGEGYIHKGKIGSDRIVRKVR